MTAPAVRQARTVAAALHDAQRRLAGAGIEDARLEAELLFAHALRSPGPARITRAQVLASLADPVEDESAAVYETLLARRLRREPLAYIVGSREFYSLDIACAPGVLIPRPETELLAEVALRAANAAEGDVTVADVGTGTGAIAIAVASHASRAHVTAIDCAPEALAVARRNVAGHGLGFRVSVVEGDLLAAGGRFDVILANLPYVPRAMWPLLQPEVRDHEARAAIVGGELGSEIIERLLAQAPAALAPSGLLAVEIDPSQAEHLVDRARACMTGAEVTVKKDHAGHDRVLVARS